MYSLPKFKFQRKLIEFREITPQRFSLLPSFLQNSRLRYVALVVYIEKVVFYKTCARNKLFQQCTQKTRFVYKIRINECSANRRHRQRNQRACLQTLQFNRRRNQNCGREMKGKTVFSNLTKPQNYVILKRKEMPELGSSPL